MKTFPYSVVATLAAASVLWACAGNPGTGTATRERCALAAADTVYLASGPVYRDCAVDLRAKLIGQRASPDYRGGSPPTTRSTRCIEAEIQFVVDQRGTPEIATARIVRADDQALAEAMLRILPQWRYEPAQKGGTAVRQIVREKSTLATAIVVARVSGGGAAPPPPPRPSC